MRTLPHVLIALALITGCVSAEDAAAPSGSDSAADPEAESKATAADPEPELANSTETLLAEPPDEYSLAYQFNNESTRLAEFVPPGETVAEWNTKLYFESHADLTDTDPIEIVIAEAKRLEEHCSFVRHFNLFSGFENGYPTSVRMIMCGEHELLERGEVSIAKAIQGNDYLYVVRIARRVPPYRSEEQSVAAEEVANWSSYLSRISVCDTADDAHPCPEATDDN